MKSSIADRRTDSTIACTRGDAGIRVGGGSGHSWDRPEREQGYSISQSESRLIIGDREWIDTHYPHLDDEQKNLMLITIESEARYFEMLRSYESGEETMLPMSEPLVILYTSGTTGLPKGVMNSQTTYWRSDRQAMKPTLLWFPRA